MGWSCSAAATVTLDALSAYATVMKFEASNCISERYWFEIDMVEHEDGSITGEVMDVEDGRVIGKAKIDGSGAIEAMPGIDMDSFKDWCRISSRWRKIADLPHGKAERSPGF